MWFAVTGVFLGMFIVAGIWCVVGDLVSRVIAMEVSAALATIALVTFAEASGRDVYFDLALVLAVMAFVGTVVFLRLLGSWI